MKYANAPMQAVCAWTDAKAGHANQLAEWRQDFLQQLAPVDDRFHSGKRQKQKSKSR